jgi:hypothetical protein
LEDVVLSPEGPLAKMMSHIDHLENKNHQAIGIAGTIFNNVEDVSTFIQPFTPDQEIFYFVTDMKTFFLILKEGYSIIQSGTNAKASVVKAKYSSSCRCSYTVLSISLP